MQASASKLPYVAKSWGRPASQILCPAVRVLEWIKRAWKGSDAGFQVRIIA